MSKEKIEWIDNLLEEDTPIELKYETLLRSIKVLQLDEQQNGFETLLNELILLIEKNIDSFEREKKFLPDVMKKYVQKYKSYWNEYMKYQLLLVGSEEDRRAVKQILNYERIHLAGEKEKFPEEDNGLDFIMVCSDVTIDISGQFHQAKIIRYDFIRWCAYKFSPESAFLDLRLRQKMDGTVSGAVTGLSYQQRGINYNKIKNNIVCLASPTQDLYLDYHNFLWFYNEVVNKRNGKIKYCIIGMDFYRLWYDLSLSPQNKIRMLCHYKKIKCIHHFHEMDHAILQYEEDLKLCKELLVENYMDIDYCRNFQPELYYEKENKVKYNPTNEEEKQDQEKVKQIFNKPYPLTFSENVGILEKYLKFLLMKDIKILIYIPPFPKIFNELTPGDMKQTTLELLLTLKEKFGFDLLDLSEAKEFTNNHFADWSHLNSAGADLATDFINNFMEKIWGGRMNNVFLAFILFKLKKGVRRNYI